MSSQTKILNNATDAYVLSNRPKLNKSTQAKLKASAGGDGKTHRSFLFFSLPFPLGSTVLDSKFRLTQANAVTGSITITVQKVTGKWNAGKLNWDNQPTSTATNSVSLTKTSPGVDTLWEFDLDAMMTDVSNGGVWWGFRVTSSVDAPILFYSAQGNSTGRPEFEATWSDQLEPPENPSPAGGRAVSVNKPLLSATAEDDSGNTEIVAIQVQYKASNTGFDPITGFSTPTWDSGTYATSSFQMDTNTIVGAPTINGTLTWWTARYQDASGVWSTWMDPESFKFVALPAVTLDNPPNATPSVVNDATPPVLWTGTGQVAYKVTVALASEPNTILWNSGKITTTVDDTAIPDKILKKLNTDYIIDLYWWDGVNREKNGANQIYKRITRTFQFQPSGSVTSVSALAAAQVSSYPWVDLTWTRTTAPDEFNILRDGDVIETNLTASSLSTGGTGYSYRDKLASPREAHVWSVQAVVNSVASNKADSNSLTTRLLAPMMMELDGTNPVYFMNPALDPELITIQEVQQPVNADPVLLTQYLGGYSGHLDGVFADGVLSGVTARQMRNNFKRWKKRAGDSFILYMVDEVMIIIPYNMTYAPRARSGTVLYDVSFDYFEVSQ